MWNGRSPASRTPGSRPFIGIELLIKLANDTLQIDLAVDTTVRKVNYIKQAQDTLQVNLDTDTTITKPAVTLKQLQDILEVTIDEHIILRREVPVIAQDSLEIEITETTSVEKRTLVWPEPHVYEPQRSVPVTILTPDLKPVAIVDDYESLQYTRRWHEPGNFEIHINRYKNNAGEFQRGRLIMIDNDPNRVGIIKFRHIRVDRSGKLSEEWVIRGKGIKAITEQRITVPPDLNYDLVNNEPAETAMKQYVDHNLVNTYQEQLDPAEDRKVELIEIAENQERGVYVIWNSRYKNLAAELRDLSYRSGLGWDITINFNTGKWIFDVISSVDRSIAQNQRPPVIFSIEHDVIEEMEYIESDDNFKNLAFVAGQGEGAERDIARATPDIFEATRTEALYEHWLAGQLDDIYPMDDDLALDMEIPAGEDVSRLEETTGHWNDAALLLRCGGSGGVLEVTDTNPSSQTWDSPGTYSWSVPYGVKWVEALIAAGGGGGGRGYKGTWNWVGGGGGAGGLVTHSKRSVSGSETVKVGKGGERSQHNERGFKGDNSEFRGLTAEGGGGGANGEEASKGYVYDGGNGGCGGGGCTSPDPSSSGGSGSQGGDGGDGGSYDERGGGGGMGGDGGDLDGARGPGINTALGYICHGGYGGALGDPDGHEIGDGASSAALDGEDGTYDAGDGHSGVVRLTYEYDIAVRVSNALDISYVRRASGSEITWDGYTPQGAEIKVFAVITEDDESYPAITSGAWQEQTSGQPLTMIEDEGDYIGKRLWIKTELHSGGVQTGSSTPYVNDLFVEITDYGVAVYWPDGERTSPPMSLEGAIEAQQSNITWSATIPEDTSLVIECAVNDDPDTEPADGEYTEAIHGESVPGITEGMVLNEPPLYLWTRQKFESDAPDYHNTPKLHSLSVSVLGAGVEDVIIPEGIDRYEMFVDARDLEQEEFLPSRGRSRLSEHAQVTYLEGQLLRHGIYQYIADYDLGDIVTVRNIDWGITMNARITEITEVYEPARFSLYLVYDQNRPTLIDKVKQSLLDIEHEVRK